MLTGQQLGWVAGVLDFKGKIVHKRNEFRVTPQLVLYVETKEQAIIQMLSKMTGTKPEYQRSEEIPQWMRRGCSEHCPEPHVHVATENMSTICRWTVTGAALAVIVFNVQHSLVSRRGLIEAKDQILDNTVLKGQGSGATTAAIRRLHKLGWSIPPQYKEVLEET